MLAKLFGKPPGRVVTKNVGEAPRSTNPLPGDPVMDFLERQEKQMVATAETALENFRRCRRR